MRKAFQIQRSVVFALFLREIKTRFGQARLGYLWAIVEPTLHVVILLTMFTIVRGRIQPGFDYAVFVTTGIVPFLFFTHMVSRSLATVDANRGLFWFRQVTPFDAVVARTILEALISAGILLILIAGLGMLGRDVAVRAPLELLGTAGLLLAFVFGCSMLCCVVGALFPESKRILPFLIRPLYFISGVIFPISVIPQQYQALLLWNPILHLLELIRAYYFSSYTLWHGDVTYVVVVTVAINLVAIAWYRMARYRIATAEA